MKNKLLQVLSLVIALTIFAVMAISSGSDDSQETKPIQDTQSVTDSTGSVGSTEDDSQETQKPIADSTGNIGSTEKVTIDEAILLEQDGIKITAKEYVSDSIFGDGIKLLIENNSANDITVGCTALIVNNYMISDLFSCSVAAGKKANETMYLLSSELEAAGINTVGQVEIYFHVYDSTSWDTLLEADVVTIKTSAFDSMVITPNDSGTELYNADGIKIVGKYVDENSFWGAGILLYIENNTNRNIIVQADDVSINGFMVSSLLSSTVYSGKMAIDDITFFSSDLEENGIESIEDVELKFHILDSDSWDTIVETDAIGFTTK
jgi:hypothetical protein